MMGFFDSLAPAPASFHRRRARAQDDGVRAGARCRCRRLPADDPFSGAKCVRPRLSQSARHGGGLRQGRPRPRRAAASGLRLHRGRHADAAPAAGQSEAAPVPAARGSRSHQPLRLQQRRPRRRRANGCWRARRAAAIVGVNIGANKDSTDRAADYVAGIEAFADVASYFTVNISSPNTPGLRDLQQAAALDDLLARVLDARDAMPPNRAAPAGAAEDRAGSGAGRSRRCRARRPRARRRRHDRLQHHDVAAGFLARRQRAARPAAFPARRCSRSSTRMLAQTFVRVEGQFPLVGVGGVDRRKRPGPRSKPARPWSSFIPRWSMKASASSRASRRGWSRI